jgi:selenocysteine lyase/cysteine desulfurase
MFDRSLSHSINLQIAFEGPVPRHTRNPPHTRPRPLLRPTIPPVVHTKTEAPMAQAMAAAVQAEAAAATPRATARGRGGPLPHLQQCIYLDWNATTPIFPEVTEAMQPFTFEAFGNPSSRHVYGARTAAAVAAARAAVAALVNAAAPSEIVFTGCGTESDNMAIWGAVAAARKRAGKPQRAGASGGSNGGAAPPLPHVVTSAVEHPAVLACLEALQEQGLCT